MGKASTRAQNRYIAKAYDRINLTVPKGRKEILQGYTQQRGESVNGFIWRAILETITHDGNGPLAIALSIVGEDTPLSPNMIEALNSLQARAETAQGAGEVSFPPDVLEAAQRAADAEGESVGDFLRRAVETQAERDKAFRKMDINPATGEKLDQSDKGGADHE